MIPNRIREKWAEGQAVINGWLSIASPFTAEIMAAQGYDSLTIDIQHGMMGLETATTMMQAIRASGAAPIIRVPWLEPAGVMKALDCGALAVICPMIDTREQAEQLISYMRYPPLGGRSFGPTRAAIAHGAEYGAQADDQVICLAMIETAEAMANLDQIVATPGLDGVYIGPSDLTLGLTGRGYRTGLDREEPEMLEAIHAILRKAHEAGIRACLHCGGAGYAAKAVGWGFDMVTLANDVRLLAAAARGSVAEARAGIGALAGRESRVKGE